ncbi:MAG: DegV family protein [Firmicutes bacterium]|nr:DegV family protein [Bacillota bacterium]
MKYTIIADSACDLIDKEIKSAKINFVTVPLIISMNDKNFVDELDLNKEEFYANLKANKQKPTTACPSPEAFASKMREGGDNIICVTISSKLSGTYNSAYLAAAMVKEEQPNKNIFVLDSLGASAGEAVLIYELINLIENSDKDFSQICEEITNIRNNTRTRFLLQDFGNLIKTGRMSKVQAIIATMLNIKLICGDNGAGEIKQVAKCIGIKKALGTIASLATEKLSNNKKTPITISHCQNQEEAEQLKEIFVTAYGAENVEVREMRGLASFYANIKGIVVGF